MKLKGNERLAGRSLGCVENPGKVFLVTLFLDFLRNLNVLLEEV